MTTALPSKGDNLTRLHRTVNYSQRIVRSLLRRVYASACGKPWRDGRETGEELLRHFANERKKVDAHQRDAIEQGAIEKFDVSLMSKILLLPMLSSRMTEEESAALKHLAELRNFVMHFAGDEIDTTEYNERFGGAKAALKRLGAREEEIKKLADPVSPGERERFARLIQTMFSDMMRDDTIPPPLQHDDQVRTDGTAPLPGSNGFVPCPCGYDLSRHDGLREQLRPCGTTLALRNHLTFPSFADLLEENSPSTVYYGGWDGVVLTPLRHWCFFGEIVSTSMLMRPIAVLRTRFGERDIVAAVYFSHPTNENERREERAVVERLAVGNTVFVNYGERHDFLDGSVGLRLEQPSLVHVFRATWSELSVEADRLLKNFNATPGQRRCVECEVSESTRGGGTRFAKCSGCHLTYYCSDDCQRISWNKIHKRLCKETMTLLGYCLLPNLAFVGEEYYDVKMVNAHAAETVRKRAEME